MAWLRITRDEETGDMNRELHPGKPSFEELQAGVGGNIEAVTVAEFGGKEVTCYVNEEGKVLNLAPTVFWEPLRDVLCGPLVITGTDFTTGETISVPRTLLERLTIGRQHLISFGLGLMLPIMEAPRGPWEVEGDKWAN